jgi:hypothetical protein
MILRDLCLVEPRLDGDDPVDDLVGCYVEFVAARCRPNTVAVTRSDLGVFFSVIDKAPGEITSADVLGFIAEQRRPRGDGRVVRLTDGEAGLSARTIKRRLASVSGFFGYLTIIGVVASNPVPRGLSTRRRGASPRRAAGAHTPNLAQDPRARRGRRPGWGAATVAGPGDGRGNGAGRPAPLRGPGPASGGPAGR